MATRLQDHYKTVVRPAMQKRFAYDNPMRVPKLDKIIVNMGVGEGSRDSKLIVAAVEELTAISGQKPIVTKAKQSISNFKLREGMDVGARSHYAASACTSSSIA